MTLQRYVFKRQRTDCNLDVGKARHLERRCHDVEERFLEQVYPGPDAIEDERHAAALVGHVQRIR